MIEIDTVPGCLCRLENGIISQGCHDGARVLRISSLLEQIKLKPSNDTKFFILVNQTNDADNDSMLYY